VSGSHCGSIWELYYYWVLCWSLAVAWDLCATEVSGGAGIGYCYRGRGGTKRECCIVSFYIYYNATAFSGRPPFLFGSGSYTAAAIAVAMAAVSISTTAASSTSVTEGSFVEGLVNEVASSS
jgi:hypothetical protein